jgi:hypothetical protein
MQIREGISFKRLAHTILRAHVDGYMLLWMKGEFGHDVNKWGFVSSAWRASREKVASSRSIRLKYRGNFIKS